jgi:ABC-type branched-subunit amino acid transport system ATPase component
LEKTYASKGGRVTALAQVNLTIRRNEFITLVGPARIDATVDLVEGTYQLATLVAAADVYAPGFVPK